MKDFVAFGLGLDPNVHLQLFSSPADHTWYRAVVLEVGETEVSVLYADYGNSEMVPFSRVLPIPAHLLQLPFPVVRCTLSGETKVLLSITDPHRKSCSV